MPTRIFGRAFSLCLAVLGGVPAHAADPSFADLLDRANSELSAGRRWEPPGDNLADTIMTLFKLAPTATPQQLATFADLLERDRKLEQADSPEQPPTSPEQPPTPAGPPAAVAALPPEHPTSEHPASEHPASEQPAPEQPAPEQTAPEQTAPEQRLATPVSPEAPASVPPQAPAPLPPAAPAKSAATEPAPAPAPAPRRIARAADAHAADLFARGKTAERNGDISGARRFYASAAERGSSAAALALGRLYDPAFLGRTVLGGIDPDPALARQWYERAADMGDRDAAPLLQALTKR